jgi:hypothetical protein
LNWLAGVIRSGSDFDVKTWGQSAADWMDEEIASYWGDMTSGNVLADEYIGWIQFGAMQVTDLGRYGTSAGEAAYFTEGDLLDRLSVGSRDLVRGGEMLAMLAGAVNKAGVGKAPNKPVTTGSGGEPTTRVYHGGNLQGGKVQPRSFSTTTSPEHATRYAERHGGLVTEFEVPTRRLYELEADDAVRRFTDQLQGAAGHGTEFRFRSDVAVELNGYRR